MGKYINPNGVQIVSSGRDQMFGPGGWDEPWEGKVGAKGWMSVRAAVTASGPRTVLFRVAGTIVLTSDIKITQPNLTIAGQTAPGGGITYQPAPCGEREAEIFDELLARPASQRRSAGSSVPSGPTMRSCTNGDGRPCVPAPPTPSPSRCAG